MHNRRLFSENPTPSCTNNRLWKGSASSLRNFIVFDRTARRVFRTPSSYCEGVYILQGKGNDADMELRNDVKRWDGERTLTTEKLPVGFFCGYAFD